MDSLFFEQNKIILSTQEELRKTLISPGKIRELMAALRKFKGEEINSLLYECKRRMLNHKIDQVLDKAHSLGNKEGESKEVAALRYTIHSLCENNALSMENRQMILLARKLLQKVAPNGKMLRLPHDDEFGEEAFAIAALLYRGEWREALIHLRKLPEWVTEEINEWLVHVGVLIEDMETFPDFHNLMKVRIGVIRGLVGFATGELPSAEEVNRLFSEVESVTESA